MLAAAQVDPDTGIPPWLPGGLDLAWSLLATQPFVLALVLVVSGLLLALVARALVLFVGLRITTRTSTALDDDLVRLVAGVTALVIATLGLVAAVEALPLTERAGQITVRVLVSLLVLQLMRVGLRASRLGLQVLSRVRDRFAIVEERTLPLFDLVMTVLVVGLAAYALLEVWHIDPTAWLASAGVVGIAVGFAARDTLANLFAGFFIIADAPYQVGDYVVLDSGERGEITRVGIRSTRLLTRDDVEVIIPNSVMASTKIINESGGRWVKFRIRLKVGVAYGSDVDRVLEVLEAVARANLTVCRDPEPRVRMRGFGDSSLDFELLCWVTHPSERGLVTHELYVAIYKVLAAHRIEIPFPQRDLWVRTMPRPPAVDPEEDAAPPAT